MIASWPRLAEFAALQDFPLDDFQVESCRAVEDGRGVLVAAPTGAGKTVVGEFAVHLALATGRKAFYTTPIKALSNQKYADLVRRHGADQVGLLTGDASINGEAPVVVMTTEVLRNMMYAGSSTLRGLGWVVMDEVHYLADRFRGAVGEEVIIHLPPDVSVVSLSATVSNAEEFGAWLGEVRGDTEVVVSEHRPVPLWQHMMVGQTMFDLFVEEVGPGDRRTDDRDATDGHNPLPPGMVPVTVNPDLVHAIRGTEARGAWDSHWVSSRDGRHKGRTNQGGQGGGSGQGARGGSGGGRGRGRDDWAGAGRRDATSSSQRSGAGGGGGGGSFTRGGRAGGGASRVEVIERLEREGLLPAITFIFSRAGCEGAVGQLLASGMRLISEAEGERNRRVVEQRIQGLADEDLSVLGYWDFADGIARGFAAHHAGMLPTFREIVEELFTQGRVKAVFATETLALGINMPARTVVLEKLVKFNGESHVDISPAEYTQLTGRAGRRGIDIEGHAVVLWNRGLDPAAVAGLASTRTYPLRSSFRPTYNMAVNLVRQFGRETARTILETSFAQFQADRAVVGFVRTVRRNEEALTGYEESMRCHLGDFREYAAIRDEIRELERDGSRRRSASVRDDAAESLEALKIGDIVRIPAGRHSGLAVVVMPNRGGRGEAASPAVVTEDHQLRRLSLHDAPTPLEPLGTMRVPKQFNARNPKARRDLAATLRAQLPHDPPARRRGAVDVTDPSADHIDELRRRMRAHPCHQCPDREHHARWAERWSRLRRETDALQAKIDGRTNSVAKTFDRICGLLVDMGYLGEGGASVTTEGERLRQLYTEKDLLAAECLRAGLWTRLDAPSLAAVVSTLIHEPRREEGGLTPRWPNDDVREAYDRMITLWSALEDAEGALALPRTGMPDGGLAWAVHRWASGQRLEEVLRGTDLAAGDFVRRCKQIIDLLGQLTDAADPVLSAVARSASDKVMRGVVAADRLD
ncbi:MAG: box helicase domain protein [Humibacillus sp.]|nr:box helicase domain protein [Humibacillus sp.]